MRQWFRGVLEGHYVGMEGERALPARSGQVPHRIHVYRAVIDDIVPIAEPEPARREAAGLHQTSIPHVTLQALLGGGRTAHGAVHDVHLEAPRFSHPARHGGKLYGRVDATVTAWIELPDEAPGAEVAAVRELDAPPVTAPADALAVTTATTSPGEAPGQEPDAEHAAADADVSAGSAPAVDAPQAFKVAAPSWMFRLPLVSLTVLVAIGLLVACRGVHAAVWLTFMVPTLVLRRFLLGVLDDSRPTRAIGGVTFVINAFCVALLLFEWAHTDCKELHPLPLLGVVLSVFFASLLPYALPVAVNAAGFALVLFSFCAIEPGSCRPLRAPAARATSGGPSVHDPGVPRTNPDGSWPRTPGASEP